MGIYDRDYMKRTGTNDSRRGDPRSAEEKLENFARNLLVKKRFFKILGVVLALLILAGLLLTMF